MTDEPAQVTASEPDPSRDRARIEPSATPRRTDLLPGLYLLGFVALAGAMYFLWANPPESRLAPQEANRVDTLQADVAALRDQVAALKARPPGPSEADLAKLQQQVADTASRPIPPPVSLQPVEARIAALEARPTATPEQVQQLGNQVISLARQTPDLQPVKDRLDALEKRPTVDPAALDKRIGDLGSQQKQLDGQQKQLDEQEKQTASQVQQLIQADKDQSAKLDALDGQTKRTADQLSSLAQKSQLATRLQGAAAALAAGNKLGDIPGAPPALARFAAEAPPTEASLRAAFDSYAAQAQQASTPGTTAQDNFAERMWTRAQGAVTVRQGEHVLVGDPIAGVIAHARETLDTGDLGGAVKALDGLTGPAATAMRPWVEKARSLLDARGAIASMAAG